VWTGFGRTAHRLSARTSCQLAAEVLIGVTEGSALPHSGEIRGVKNTCPCL